MSQNKRITPHYKTVNRVIVGICWDCGPTPTYMDSIKREVQSTMAHHGNQLGHETSVFDVYRDRSPSYAVHCHECGFERFYDYQNSETPSVSAGSALGGHSTGGCADIEKVRLP